MELKEWAIIRYALERIVRNHEIDGAFQEAAEELLERLPIIANRISHLHQLENAAESWRRFILNFKGATPTSKEANRLLEALDRLGGKIVQSRRDESVEARQPGDVPRLHPVGPGGPEGL